jgi:signal transduction histidine kinase
MTESTPILRRVAVYLALLNAAAGLAVIAGWEFRIPVLKGQASGTFIAPNAALCFVCCSVSLLFQLSRTRTLRFLGQMLATLIAAFALASGVEYLLGIDLGIDRLFMAHGMSDWNLPLAGRFTVNSAIGFFLAGISLVTLRRRAGRPLSELLALLLVLLSYLSVIGHLYGASSLYDHVMAVHTALLFGVLGVALMCGASRHLVLQIVFTPLAGAIAARKMIFVIALLLPAFGFMELWAEHARYVSVQFGNALSVLAAVTVFIVLALRIASVLNATDRKRLEIENALERSRQIAAAGRMAASVAHEINNPLEAVGNIIYLLKRDTLPLESRNKYPEIAEQELKRVAMLARRTLGFYKEDSKPVETEVCELIENVLEIYRNKLTGKVTVRRRYEDEARIVAKAGEIRQVLANLVANAIDALPSQGGALEIGVSREEQNIVIEVRDEGHGIAKEDLERVFEPFFTTKKEVGTGLGLWVSKDLVVKNGGTVEVMSSTRPEDHGTTFRLSFPAAANEGQGSTTRSVAESA